LLTLKITVRRTATSSKFLKKTEETAEQSRQVLWEEDPAFRDDQDQEDQYPSLQPDTATEVSLEILRCRLFDRTEETKRLEKEIRIKIYKD